MGTQGWWISKDLEESERKPFELPYRFPLTTGWSQQSVGQDIRYPDLDLNELPPKTSAEPDGCTKQSRSTVLLRGKKLERRPL
jgi:hypothetical protein